MLKNNPWSNPHGLNWSLSAVKIKNMAVTPSISLACLIVGLLVMLPSHALGAWPLTTGVALCIYERTPYDRMLALDLDTVDGLVELEVRGESVAAFKNPKVQKAQRPLDETSGIRTGVAPDIHAQVENRKAKRAAQETVSSAAQAPHQNEGTASAPKPGATAKPAAPPDDLVAD